MSPVLVIFVPDNERYITVRFKLLNYVTGVTLPRETNTLSLS